MEHDARHTPDEAILDADQALVEQLMAEGFVGKNWEAAGSRFSKQLHTVILAWLRTGHIFRHSAAKGRGLRPPPFPLSDEERADLTRECVSRGLNLFRTKSLAGDGWNRAFGKTLASYLVDDCLFEFSNLWRSWSYSVDGSQRSIATDRLAEELPGIPEHMRYTASHEAAVVDRIYAQQMLARFPDELQVALQLMAEGFSQQEAAAVLGITRATQEGRLRRSRARLLGNEKEAGG